MPFTKPGQDGHEPVLKFQCRQMRLQRSASPMQEAALSSTSSAAFVPSRSPLPTYLEACSNLSATVQAQLQVLSERAGSFSLTFLTATLGGTPWSPGYFHVTSKDGMPPCGSGYYIVDVEVDPYVPTKPGAFGAKVSAVLRPCGLHEEAEKVDSVSNKPSLPLFIDSPLFVAHTNASGTKRCIYLGSYSQLRFRNKLDHQRQLDNHFFAAKKFWAAQLCESHRPQWMTSFLIQHFYPRPTYEGPMRWPKRGIRELPARTTERSVTSAEFQDAWRRYLLLLQEWEDEAEAQVSGLTPEDIMRAFDEPDSTGQPCLRLWWEYLVCTGGDANLIDRLVAARDHPDEEIHTSKLANIFARLTGATTHSKEPYLVPSKKHTVETWLGGLQITSDSEECKAAYIKNGTEPEEPTQRARPSANARAQHMYVPPHLRAAEAMKASEAQRLEQQTQGAAESNSYVPYHLRKANGQA